MFYDKLSIMSNLIYSFPENATVYRGTKQSHANFKEESGWKRYEVGCTRRQLAHLFGGRIAFHKGRFGFAAWLRVGQPAPGSRGIIRHGPPRGADHSDRRRRFGRRKRGQSSRENPRRCLTLGHRPLGHPFVIFSTGSTKPRFRVSGHLTAGSTNTDVLIPQLCRAIPK